MTRKVVWLLATSAAMTTTVAGAAPAENDTTMSRIYAHCPHYAAAEADVKSRTLVRAYYAGSPSLPALRRELLLRASQDQDARQRAIASDSDEEVREIDARNLGRLRYILVQGLPTVREIGADGVGALWLLIQHADEDHSLQARALRVFEARAHRGAFSLSNYALLFDRVQVAQGKPQRYGSQMHREGNTFQPGALEDPVHVDARRRAMGLVPLEDYRCAVEAVYDQAP